MSLLLSSGFEGGSRTERLGYNKHSNEWHTWWSHFPLRQVKSEVQLASMPGDDHFSCFTAEWMRNVYHIRTHTHTHTQQTHTHKHNDMKTNFLLHIYLAKFMMPTLWHFVLLWARSQWSSCHLHQPQNSPTTHTNYSNQLFKILNHGCQLSNRSAIFFNSNLLIPFK